MSSLQGRTRENRMPIVGPPSYRQGWTGGGLVSEERTSTAATLRRLWPYLKPVRTPVALAMAATMLAMMCGLGIPLITQQIVDGPIAGRDLDALPLLIGVVALLGCAEAALFY